MSEWRDKWRDSALGDAMWERVYALAELGSSPTAEAARPLEDALYEAVEALMAQVEADEREACAKIAEEEAEALERTATKYGAPKLAHEYLVRATNIRDVAAAIRARGKTE